MTAVAGQAVTLTLTNEIDISRGDVIVPADDPLAAGTEVTARVLWMAEEPLSPGQNIQVKLGTATANARVARLHHGTCRLVRNRRLRRSGVTLDVAGQHPAVRPAAGDRAQVDAELRRTTARAGRGLRRATPLEGGRPPALG